VYSCSPVVSRICSPTAFFHFSIAFVVVGGKEFFQPGDVVRFNGTDEFDCVLDIESHIAINHEREIGTNTFPSIFDGFHIFLKPSTPSAGPNGSGILAPLKPNFLAISGREEVQ